jgi:hypothetical protein
MDLRSERRPWPDSETDELAQRRRHATGETSEISSMVVPVRLTMARHRDVSAHDDLGGEILGVDR